uniref:Ovarian cancer G-protein coupled receptor 1-like n=1 Tax=Lepisosteus oculatus TaxID=7918 RepID=W5NMW0_LEPOC
QHSILKMDSLNFSNTTEGNSTDDNKLLKMKTFHLVIYSCFFVVVLPINFLALYGLFRLIKTDFPLPVYIINLLLSDVTRIAILPLFIDSTSNDYECPSHCGAGIMTYTLCVVAGVGFLLCISVERYVALAHPLWYRYHRSPKSAVLISLSVWVLGIAFMVGELIGSTIAYWLFLVVIFPLPLLVLVLSCAGIRRAVGRAVSVPEEEKTRIRRLMILLLGIFTGMYGPIFFCYSYFSAAAGEDAAYSNVLEVCLLTAWAIMNLSPLVDPILYIFLRRDVRDALGCLSLCLRPADCRRPPPARQGAG